MTSLQSRHLDSQDLYHIMHSYKNALATPKMGAPSYQGILVGRICCNSLDSPASQESRLSLLVNEEPRILVAPPIPFHGLLPAYRYICNKVALLIARGRSRNFKGGGGGVWRNFLQKKGEGGPTTYLLGCIANK